MPTACTPVKTSAAAACTPDRRQPLLVDPEPLHQNEDERGDQRRDVPVGEVERQQVPDLDLRWIGAGQRREAVRLRGREEPEQRGDSEHPPQRRRPRLVHSGKLSPAAVTASRTDWAFVTGPRGSIGTRTVRFVHGAVAVRSTGVGDRSHRVGIRRSGIRGSGMRDRSVDRHHDQRRVVGQLVAAEARDGLRQARLERGGAAGAVGDGLGDQALLADTPRRPRRALR